METIKINAHKSKHEAALMAKVSGNGKKQPETFDFCYSVICAQISHDISLALITVKIINDKLCHV